MPASVKNSLNDFRNHPEHSSYRNDFHHYWNGGIAETFFSPEEEPGNYDSENAINEDSPDTRQINTDSY